MQKYRRKETIDAALWVDTPENREAFADWFDYHNIVFKTRGDVIEAECPSCGDEIDIYPGQWVTIAGDGHITAWSARKFESTLEAVS